MVTLRGVAGRMGQREEPAEQSQIFFLPYIMIYNILIGKMRYDAMVIDMHVHPALYEEICGDKERVRLRCDGMG